MRMTRQTRWSRWASLSPTDTMPLTSRAKILMGIQATASLVTPLLVIARAIGALGGG